MEREELDFGGVSDSMDLHSILHENGRVSLRPMSDEMPFAAEDDPTTPLNEAFR